MTPKLTSEQRAALQLGVGPVPIQDDQTQQVYFIVDQATLDRLQREADREAIREGVADLESGRVVSLDELDAQICAKFGFPRST